jgi:hypothetical protein
LLAEAVAVVLAAVVAVLVDSALLQVYLLLLEQLTQLRLVLVALAVVLVLTAEYKEPLGLTRYLVLLRLLAVVLVAETKEQKVAVLEALVVVV